MSYDIYFLKKSDLNLRNIYDTLEIPDPKADNEIFISKSFMKSLIKELESAGLKFETFQGRDEDHFELNFPTYQISIFNSQIAISLPYWDENSNEGVNNEIKRIANIFLRNNLTGFDPQTEEFITESFEFQSVFSKTKSSVDNHLKANTRQPYNSTLKGVAIGLGIALLIFIIWKLTE